MPGRTCSCSQAWGTRSHCAWSPPKLALCGRTRAAGAGRAKTASAAQREPPWPGGWRLLAGRGRQWAAREAGASRTGQAPNQGRTGQASPGGGSCSFPQFSTGPARPSPPGGHQRLFLLGEEAESLFLVLLAQAGILAGDGGQGQTLCLHSDALGLIDGTTDALKPRQHLLLQDAGVRPALTIPPSPPPILSLPNPFPRAAGLPHPCHGRATHCHCSAWEGRQSVFLN